MKNSILVKLQTIFGVAKSELIAVVIILFGLLIGAAYSYFSDDESYNDTAQEIYKMVDSIAEAQRSTFIGTDNNSNPDPELAVGDTIVKKKKYFPVKKKKELPKEKINLNTASRVQLMKLPGIGEKTAEKIVKYREEHGFSKIEDIMKVKGIGPKKFEKMKAFLSLE